MRSPLDPYLDLSPTAEDFASVSGDELTRIIDAARDVEALTGADVRETKTWAATVRIAAERALAARNA